jgi:hypothetical protein
MGFRDSAKKYRFKSAAAGANKTVSIKGADGSVFSIHAGNKAATPAYLRLYDKATAPGTGDTPVFELMIPGNTAGAGRESAFPKGLSFELGIGMRVTTGVADNDDTAAGENDVIISLSYE